MKILLVGLLALGSLSVFSGEITTKSGTQRISSKCIEIGKHESCNKWYITEQDSNHYDTRERVIGMVTLEQLASDSLKLNFKEREVAKLQYFPATKATWGCNFDENCQGDDAFWASVVFETPMVVVFGAIPPIYDTLSMPIRSLLKAIQNKRADNFEKKVIDTLSVLVDGNADTIVVSNRKYNKYFRALDGLGNDLSLVRKVKNGEIINCRIVESIPYANLKYVDYHLYVKDVLVDRFQNFEQRAMELTIHNLIKDEKCSLKH